MFNVVLYLAAWLEAGNLHLTLAGYWLQEICGTELHVTRYKGVNSNHCPRVRRCQQLSTFYSTAQHSTAQHPATGIISTLCSQAKILMKYVLLIKLESG